MDFDLNALIAPVSRRMLFHPSDIPIHPTLEKRLAARAEVAGLIEQSFPGLNECFGLAKRRHVQIAKNIAQMLLRHRGPDRAE
jgi:hypothetical protein